MISLFFIIIGVSAKDNEIDRSFEESSLDRIMNVLYISSYSPALFTFEDQWRGIKRRFDGNKKIKLDAEFMDTKNFHTRENLQNFYNSLRYKIDSGKKYDAVIVGDDNGLVYLMEKKDILFPDIPIFFLGINNIETAINSQKDPLVTGVVEAKSFNNTINLAKTLNPSAKRVVSLVDNTTSSISELKDLMSYSSEHPDLEFSSIDISTMTFREFYKELHSIKEDDIVFYLSSITDKTGKKLSWDEMRRDLDRMLNVPIYNATNYS